MHRGDKSGTTKNFTDYLSKAAGDVWTAGAVDEWPIQGGEAANGTSGVIAAVTGRQGHDRLRRREPGRRPRHRQRSRSATRSSRRRPRRAAAVVANSDARRGPRRVRLRLRRQPHDHRRPTSTRSCWSATTSAASQYDDKAKADLVKALRAYVISEDGQKAAAERRRQLRRSPPTLRDAGADGRRRDHGGRLTDRPRATRPGTSSGRPGPSRRAGPTAAPCTPRTDQTERSVTTTSAPPEPPRAPRPKRRLGDRVFAGSATGAGHPDPARPGRRRGLPDHRGVAGGHRARRPTSPAATGSPPTSRPLLFGTLLAAVIALRRRDPAGRRRSRCSSPTTRPAGSRSRLGYVVDLLAAIPSVVYGFWGIAALAPALVPFYGWLDEHLGFIPFFAGPGLGDRPDDAHRRAWCSRS